MRTRTFGLLLAVAAGGCRPSPGDVLGRPEADDVPSRFDPARSGTVRGKITWEGEIPVVPAFAAAKVAAGGHAVTVRADNPHAPRIDARTRGLAGAVVSVANIDPADAKPLDWPPAVVEVADGKILVRQGGTERLVGPERLREESDTRRVGFVRRGGEVEIRSVSPEFEMLRARGAAFFTLPFPAGSTPLVRRVETAGRVELSSGSADYWASADLFVADHPYFAVTDAAGGFALTDVPAGRREVAVWVRNWHPAGEDRDPETGLIFRMAYRPPVEVRVLVEVTPGATTDLTVPLSAADFGK